MTGSQRRRPAGDSNLRPGVARAADADVEYWDQAYLAALVDGRDAAARAALTARDAIMRHGLEQEES